MMNHDIRDIEGLIKIINKVNGSGYGAISSLVGVYSYDNNLILAIERVPRDPNDPIPGKIKLYIPLSKIKYDPRTLNKDKLSTVASKYFFNAIIAKTIRYEGHPWLRLDQPGQAFLDRNMINIQNNTLEIRLDFIVPFKGRRKVSGGRLKRLILETIPRILKELTCTSKKRKILGRMINTIEDQEYLRRKLVEEECIAFIAEGSILPRRGNSDLPLRNAIPFRISDKYRTSFNLPNHGTIYGLCIEKGKIISFAGANFHGKTTILNALSVAHYNHVPGDGREFVISVDELPLIASENRRIIRGVNISMFMKSLPNAPNLTYFYANEASGSTSQAASLIEAIEFGAKGILIDEDSSAVNLLLKDRLLKKLVPKDLEPITPLIELLDSLKSMDITIIFAIGALGELLMKSNKILLVQEYGVTRILTREELLELAKIGKTKNSTRRAFLLKNIPIKRVPEKKTIPNGKVSRLSYDEISIIWRGKEIKVNLRGSIRKTIKEKAQLRALALAINYASKYVDGERSLMDIVNSVLEDINKYGLDALNPDPNTQFNLAKFTRYQLFYVLSRIPTLRIREK